MATVEPSVSSLLTNLTESLTSAISAFPAEESSLLPPTEGISLLDLKNELLLSYLQNLVFLIILKIRNVSEDTSSDSNVTAEAIKKLNEQRVYLEKGVRPLEGRLKYQIDTVLRAAHDAERVKAQKNIASQNRHDDEIVNGHISDSESSNDSDAPSTYDAERTVIAEASHGPKTSALLQKLKLEHSSSKSTSSNPHSGTYKPPRITPTAMHDGTRAPRDRKRKSHLIDEYIAYDLSSAPMAQPSIGSGGTILDHGRSSLSARDREKERERTIYEESNLTRLPGESKAERRKARARGEGGGRRDMFGGEDWTGLGGLGDRVSRSVSAKGQGKSGALERREKRRRDTTDSVRGDGVNLGIGENFEKRRKVLQGRMDKKSGKGKRN